MAIDSVKAVILQDDELAFCVLYFFANNEWHYGDLFLKEDINEQIAALKLKPIYDAKYSETEMKSAVGQNLHDVIKSGIGFDDVSIYTIWEVQWCVSENKII